MALDRNDAVNARTEDEHELEPDFTNQTTLADPGEAVGPDSDGAEDPLESGDDVYVPPTDPVIATDVHGRVQVLGGFSGSSMDEVEVARSAMDGEPGDEALADAVRQELKEDAATTHLDIQVEVRRGVARLRGEVMDLQEAEAAEEVAARVPGIREVREELEVSTI